MAVYGMEEELKSTDEKWELQQLRIFYQVMVGCDTQSKLLESLINDWDKVQDKDALKTWAELDVTCRELEHLYNPVSVAWE